PSTVARPYAEAVFKLADAEQELGRWADMLAALAQVVTDERGHRIIAAPNIPDAKVAGLVIAVLGGKLTAQAENFVRVLAEAKRLELLGEIRAQFEALKNEREGLIEAEVVSAFELDAAQTRDLES